MHPPFLPPITEIQCTTIVPHAFQSHPIAGNNADGAYIGQCTLLHATALGWTSTWAAAARLQHRR